MINHIEAHNQNLDNEEQVISEVRTETNSRLQTSNKRDLDHFLNSGHRRLLRKRLYNAVGDIDYQTASAKDLALAKSYLTMCGITLSLDHWVNAENLYDTIATGNGTFANPPGTSKPLTSITHPVLDTVPRPVSSTAAAFPTYPLQKAATPETPTPSDPRLAPKPVNVVTRPTGLLRAPARRRSTYKQGKPNPPSLQDSAAPVTMSESNIVPKPSNGTGIVDTPAEDPLPRPPAREYYVPPLQAVPFSLPPQFSNQQQVWLPDGRPQTSLVNNPTGQPAVMVPNMNNLTPTSNGGPQVGKGPQDAMPGRVQDALPPRNPQLSQISHRSDDATPALYDYNGNVMNATPVITENTHAFDYAYDQLRQQFSHRDQPPPLSLEVSRMNNMLSSMAPPPLATTWGLSSQLYSSISPPLQNPYALTYHTVDYGTATDIPVTAGNSWQPIAARPAPATSTSSEYVIQQRQQGFAEALEPALPTSNAIPNEGGVRANQQLPPTEEDKDDDYVPVKKGRARKAPAKASKKRKTTA